jgi:hypothetical protein
LSIFKLNRMELVQFGSVWIQLFSFGILLIKKHRHFIAELTKCSPPTGHPQMFIAYYTYYMRVWISILKFIFLTCYAESCNQEDGRARFKRIFCWAQGFNTCSPPEPGNAFMFLQLQEICTVLMNMKLC